VALTPAQAEYVLAAGMLGFAASGRPSEGRDLWTSHTGGSQAGAAVAPEVRLMLSLASGDEPHRAIR